MVVGTEPLLGNPLGLLDAFENVKGQPFVPDRSIVTIDIGILLELAGLDVGQGGAPVVYPCHDSIADVFRAVVFIPKIRLASMPSNLARDLYSVALLMPSSTRPCGAGSPLSAC